MLRKVLSYTSLYETSRLQEPELVNIVDFTDDVAVVDQARNLKAVQIYANDAIISMKIRQSRRILLSIVSHPFGMYHKEVPPKRI